jgi:two-component system, sensor histidine kinase YesM
MRLVMQIMTIKKIFSKNAYLKHISKMVDLLRMLSIRQRIIGSLLLVSIFPITLVGIYSSGNYERSVTSKLASYSGQLVQEISKNVENEVNQYEKLSEILMMDNDVKNYLKNRKFMSYNEKNSMYHTLDDKFSTELFDYKNVQDISIWADQDTVLYDMGYVSFNDIVIKQIMWATDRQKSNVYWTFIKTNSDRNCIVLCRQIYLDYNYDKIGYLFIFVDESIFANDTYKNIDLGTGSSLFILQSDRMIISTNSQSLKKGSKISEKGLIGRLQDNYENNINTFQSDNNDGGFIYASNYIPSLDWYVVGKIPYSYISFQTAEVKKSILIFCLLVILLSIILSIIIYSSIYIPLKNLLRYAKRVSDGELTVSLNDASGDELGVLSQNISLMVERLKALVDEVIDQQAKKRVAELNMLQAQINPHFLFNTLNSLRWSAMLSGNKTLEKGIGALSGLLQNTIVNSNEMITLEAEIENVNNYAIIQRIRYADSFTLVFEVEDGLKGAKILKFILQPIIENSIIHGNGDSERMINIKISAHALEGVLKIEISDDGQGFVINEQGLRSNNKKLSGIGISNVDERIRLNFGEAFGLKTESAPGKGTISYLTMPLFYEAGDKHV